MGNKIRILMLLSLLDDNIELSEVVIDSNTPSTSKLYTSNEFTEPMAHLADQYINLLISKSCFSHDAHENESNREHIMNAYKFLSSTPFLSAILMLVASSPKVKSVFDFNRDSVHVSDPTVPSNTKGMFYLSGRVYIGAKQLLDEATKSEVYATLAHEFCHYAIDLTFKNFAKPYAKNDNKTKQEFEEISQKCKKLDGIEEYIDIVYDHYPPQVQHAELIVRVPHLIALYWNEPEKLQEVRNKFIELFEFYETRIYLEMQAAQQKIENQDDLKEKEKKIIKLRKIACFSFIFMLIAIFGVIAVTCWLTKASNYNYKNLSLNDQIRIQNSTIIYKNIEIRLIDLFPKDSIAYNSLTSDYISQIFEKKILNFNDPRLKFLNNLIHHNWQNLTIKLKNKFLSSNFTYQSESFKFEKLNETSPEVFNSLTSEQIINVLDGSGLKIGYMVKDNIDYYIERRFFVEDYFATECNETEDENTKIMKNSELDLVKIKEGNMTERFDKKHNLDSKNVESLALNEKEGSLKEKNVLNAQEIKNIDKPINILKSDHQDPKSNENSVQNPISTPEVIKEAFKTGIFILNSDIGSGKTIIFQKFTRIIKSLYPTRWVSFIDLNDKNICDKLENFNKTLENNLNDTELVVNALNKFLRDVLGLNTSNKFEVEIFNNSFKTGNLVLLYDNFDLLPLKDRETILNIFNLTHNLTKSVQFISSMPLFINQLRDKLNSKIYQPVPFSDIEQKELIRSFFNLQNLTEENVENYTEGAFNISKTLQLDSPLMQKFIAQNYKPEPPNFYEICKNFVTQKIEIYLKSENGEMLINYLFSRSIKDFDLIKMYQRIAFQKELGLNHTSGLDTPRSGFEHFNVLEILKVKIPKILPVEELARMGIISFRSETDYKYLHKTIEYFFFAKYFIYNLYLVDRNLDSSEIQLRCKMFTHLMLKNTESKMITTLVGHFFKEQETFAQFPKVCEKYSHLMEL